VSVHRFASSLRLYIDETGPFDGQTASAVVGLLIESPSQDGLDRAMKSCLEEHVPEIAWPFHAAELVCESQLLAAWMRRSVDDQARSPVREHFDEARRWLLGSTHPCAVRLRAAIEGRREVERSIHRSVSVLLQSEQPALCGALSARVDAIHETLRTLLVELRRQLGEDAVSLFAAVTSVASIPTRSTGEDPYLYALRVLFERVFFLLRSRPPETKTVRVLAATRQVDDSVLGRHRLHVTDIQRAAREARETPPDGEDVSRLSKSVRLVPELPVNYRANPPAGLVLVDFVAHRLGRVLRERRTCWRDIEQTVWRATGLSVTAKPKIASHAGPIPTVAAPDPWRGRCIDWFDGVTARPVDSTPVWAVECTEMIRPWIEAAR
jgi:hypothetical protein